MTQPIHAPYHFVPLSSWIYMPEWAHLVSHDHPFEQGLSGIINVELHNLTPLLVGGETRRNDNTPAQVCWARDPDGKPLIPGTSLKGMLRNVLEIATFGKFDRIDDHRFGYRDISNSDTRYSQTIMDSQVQAAWIKYDADSKQWTLRKCRHTLLYSDDFNQFAKPKQAIVNNPQQNTLKKYQQWPLSSPAIPFSLESRTLEGTRGNPVTKECARQLGKGNLYGHVVFSGFRPGKKEYSNGCLNFNYLFYDAENGVQPLEGGAAAVSRMFDVHDAELVQHLKTQGHPEFGIPVFLRIKKDKTKDQTIAMGLTKMPKVLFDQSIEELAHHQQKALNSQSVFDFCELLFGTLSDSGFGLRSRISIADAVCTINKGLVNSTPVVLGQPRASYLNSYLEQPAAKGDVVHGDLSQYEANSKLAGWKRYPTQQAFNAHLPQDLKSKTKVQSQLELMNPGSQFSGKIVFHNLQPVELGALLWALSPNSDFHHGLGHGKSLGAGAVQINASLGLCRANNGDAPSAEQLREQFVEHMNRVYPAKQHTADAWQQSPQLRHLLAFGNRADNEGKNLSYMPLSTAKNETTVSYSSSVKGRQKSTLPAWRQKGETLPRTEELAPPAMALGRGRLKCLLEQLRQNRPLTPFEQQQLNAREAEEREAQKEAALASASELYRQCLELQEELAPYCGKTDTDATNKRQGNVGRITQLLNDCLANNSSATREELQAIYEFACNFELTGFYNSQQKPKELSKKAKERHNERKALLAQLSEIIHS